MKQDLWLSRTQFSWMNWFTSINCRPANRIWMHQTNSLTELTKNSVNRMTSKFYALSNQNLLGLTKYFSQFIFHVSDQVNF